jgi:outer membrane protein
MKRFAFSVAAALIAAVASAQGTAPAPAAGLKIGVINVERLVQESALGKEAFNRVKKINDAKKEEGEKLSKELREMEQKLADQGSAMADDKRDALQKSYQEKAIAFKRFQDDANRDLEAAQKKELSELERRVFPVINQVGKEKGYTLILNKFQSGLVYVEDSVDITDEVLKVFNTTVAVPASKRRRMRRRRPARPPNRPLRRRHRRRSRSSGLG